LCEADYGKVRDKQKEYIKKELRKLFRSMDFVSNKFLADEKAKR
jgi:hypothetical protein